MEQTCKSYKESKFWIRIVVVYGFIDELIVYRSDIWQPITFNRLESVFVKPAA